MPTRPLRYCTHPGCGALTTQGRCPAHALEWRRAVEAHRGSRQARGYGRAWDRLRAAHLAQHPLCAACLAMRPPVTTAATDVDHIKPKSQGGTDDPANLQSLCRAHHLRKSWGEGLGRAHRDTRWG